ncbi:MAG: zinc transporter ZntB [Rhodospirillales bacterium]|nr:zinc transporter ZntB [Rhodospirillales bacterium]
MDASDDLICAFLKSTNGQWKEIGWPEIKSWKSEDGLLWVHLDRNGPEAIEYLQTSAGLDSVVSDALLADESRPRALEIDDGLLVNLRGVNLNPGADPDDMVSIRVWARKDRIISSRRRKLMAINDIRERIAKNRGPNSAGEFIAELSTRLVERMADVIDDLDSNADELEALVVTGERSEIRAKLADIRMQSINLRRYLAPQREALSRIQNETFSWLDTRQKSRLREASDRLIRYVEDLDSIRERATVIQDEVMSRFSEEMNKNMYILAIVATILLPLGFLTGLLGINVDGLPGSKDTPWAFSMVIGLCVAFVAIEVGIMKKLKWF